MFETVEHSPQDRPDEGSYQCAVRLSHGTIISPAAKLIIACKFYSINIINISTELIVSASVEVLKLLTITDTLDPCNSHYIVQVLHRGKSAWLWIREHSRIFGSLQ